MAGCSPIDRASGLPGSPHDSNHPFAAFVHAGQDTTFALHSPEEILEAQALFSIAVEAARGIAGELRASGQTAALTSIVFSVISLEAFLNEPHEGESGVLARKDAGWPRSGLWKRGSYRINTGRVFVQREDYLCRSWLSCKAVWGTGTN